MLDLDNIKKVIADAVELVTAIEVIFANQNAPRPEDSYASVFVTPSSKTGYDDITYNNDLLQDLDETIEGHRQLNASINFFRDDAYLNASKFVTQLQSNTLIELFNNNNLGYAGVSEIRDISEVDKNLWEERTQLDLTFYALSNFTDTVIAIEEANVNGTAESGNNATDININIT